MTEKLRDCFDEMVVYKDLKKSNFFSALGLPSFLRDWLLKKFADDEGNLDVDELTDFITPIFPIKKNGSGLKIESLTTMSVSKSSREFLWISASKQVK